MKKVGKTKEVLEAVVLLSIFALWIILLYNFSPTEVVDFVGTENGYFLALVLALIGGTFVFFPFPYHIVIFTLAAGGLNPFLLGLFAGTGVLIGDSTSYLIGYTGREIISGRPARIFKKLYDWAIKKPKWVLPTFLYLYSSFIPTPNDFLVIPLGFARYPYTKVVIPLWLGAITFNTLLALAGIYGFDWILNYLG